MTEVVAADRPSDDPGVVRRTQIVDLARAVPLGALFTLETSILLTIAIRQFDAPGVAKGLVAAATGIGLLTSTVVTALARRSSRSAMKIASVVVAAGAGGFVLASTGSLALFVVGSILGVAAVYVNLPLVTATYERNFPAAERGHRVGRALSIKVAVTALVGVAAGAWYEREPQHWWIIVLLGAVATGTLSVLNWRMPSEPLAAEPAARRNPWPHFEVLRDDADFRLLIITWMVMGFGNLMLLPLRIEYLAQPEYGIQASATMITVLTVAVPSVVRLVITPFAGRVFDRTPFFSLRIALNLVFASYALVFFTSTHEVALWGGMALLGVAFALGELIWMLWVTKFAPAGRVADYMGLHTFFTGVRAVAAPLVAFAVVERLTLHWVALIGTGLMLLSALLLVPRARRERSGSGRLRRHNVPA